MKKLVYLINSDLFRYGGNHGIWAILKGYFKHKGFRFTFWFRVCQYFSTVPLFSLLTRLIYSYQKKVLVVDIDFRTKIGEGLCIYHVFSTAIDGMAVIGKNFVLSHCVTIGGTINGKHPGVPVIGDNVCVGPGALIIGGIKVGNNVVIGGNAVVTKDIPDNSVVVGNPGRIISDKGAIDYVRYTDYEMILKK